MPPRPWIRRAASRHAMENASGQAPMFSPAPSCDRMKPSGVAPGGPRTRHAARLDRYRLCARLYRTLVRGRELWGPDAAVRSRWSIPALHLSTLACNLLHLLDVLRFCRPRLTDRIRLFDDLCGPGPHDRFLLTGHHAHRAARENPEHHIDR